ncbi:hypothetical protein TRIUR3_01275 [Triticum urartu]|uniref:Uncharacterized protein n=1 Tax=Triticum urartu TaxID=4572 RepID=M7YGX1_TRIUA|nr:hypothetical protein TRIUR3_01275 [Triticum urartu]
MPPALLSHELLGFLSCHPTLLRRPTIRDKIRDERPACEQVEQCRRLSDPSVSNKGFELDARQITQEIGLISTIIDREKASIQSLMADVREIVSHVDFAICAYGKVRQRFEKQLEECCKLIGELEQLVKTKNDKTHPGSLKSLPKVMSNVHDYLIFVASKVENLHQHAETIRTQYLNDLRNSGNWNDPFVEADRKEAAKQEAAARIVHPTLPVTFVYRKPWWRVVAQDGWVDLTVLLELALCRLLVGGNGWMACVIGDLDCDWGGKLRRSNQLGTNERSTLACLAWLLGGGDGGT